MNLTVKLIQCTENKDPENSGNFQIHISVYACAAVVEREVWGNPETLSGFHEDRVIVIIILRHILPFFAVSVFALMMRKQRQGKLPVQSMSEAVASNCSN